MATVTLTRNQLTLPETEEVEQKIASLRLTGARIPLKLGHSLDKFEKIDATPLIGTEFARGIQVADWLKSPNADELIKDLAILSTSALMRRMCDHSLPDVQSPSVVWCSFETKSSPSRNKNFSVRSSENSLGNLRPPNSTYIPLPRKRPS